MYIDIDIYIYIYIWCIFPCSGWCTSPLGETGGLRTRLGRESGEELLCAGNLRKGVLFIDGYCYRLWSPNYLISMFFDVKT